MSFGGLILTNEGRNKVAAAVSEKKALQFTHIQLGDASFNGSYSSKTKLSNMVMEMPITSVQRKDNEVLIECDWNSTLAPTAFYLREIGIIGNGVLCYYDNVRSGDAEYIDPESNVLTKQKRFRFMITVTDDVEITTMISSELYALAEEVEQSLSEVEEKKLDKKGDASDTTAIFTETEERENILSGDKMSILFGKIKKFFGDLKTVAFSSSYKDLIDKPTVKDFGLDNVDNTSDENKPVSKEQATAIADAKKAGTDAQANLEAHAEDKNNPHAVTKDQVGLGNVENKSSVTIRSEITSSNVTTALGYTPLNQSTKGANYGVAELDATGKVPSSQLPSYVDDVMEGYLYNSKFYKETAHTSEIIGESSKIYIDISSGKTYRWSGSAFAVISDTLALGETSSTAYRGDRGKEAYEHSQKKSGNPHGVTKSDVGLENVPNVSTNDQVPTFVQASSRVNIASGEKMSSIFGKIMKFFSDLKTVAFSGSYKDLSNRPNYAGSSSEGGSADSAVKLNTSAGSSSNPVYFLNGKPVACGYNLSTISDTVGDALTIASDALAIATANKAWIANKILETATGTTSVPYNSLTTLCSQIPGPGTYLVVCYAEFQNTNAYGYRGLYLCNYPESVICANCIPVATMKTDYYPRVTISGFITLSGGSEPIMIKAFQDGISSSMNVEWRVQYLRVL